MSKTHKFRVVVSKVAGNKVYHLEKRGFFGSFKTFKVSGATPSFTDPEIAREYVSQWGGSNTRKVVEEFDFKA